MKYDVKKTEVEINKLIRYDCDRYKKVYIYEPLFNTKLHFYVGKNKDSIYSDIIKIFDGAEVDKLTSSGRFMYSDHFDDVVIYVLKNDSGIVAHEVSHLVDRIMSNVGSDCGEMRAYLMQYYIDFIEIALKK